MLFFFSFWFTLYNGFAVLPGRYVYIHGRFTVPVMVHASWRMRRGLRLT